MVQALNNKNDRCVPQVYNMTCPKTSVFYIQFHLTRDINPVWLLTHILNVFDKGNVMTVINELSNINEDHPCSSVTHCSDLQRNLWEQVSDTDSSPWRTVPADPSSSLCRALTMVMPSTRGVMK